MISNKEKAILHVAKNQLGMDDDTYRDFLRMYGGVESSKDLSKFAYEKVLTRLKELGFKVKPKQPQYRATNRDANALPSPAQLQAMSRLYHKLGWTEGCRRIGFARRVIKKPWPQTRADASKIIEALKAMAARQEVGR